MWRRSPRSRPACSESRRSSCLDQSFSNSFLLFMFGALDPSLQGGGCRTSSR